MSKAYAVTYQIKGNAKEFSSNCTISDKYGTTFGDIPKMISIRRGCAVEDIEILTLRLLFVDEDVQPAPVVINIHGANHGAIQM